MISLARILGREDSGEWEWIGYLVHGDDDR